MIPQNLASSVFRVEEFKVNLEPDPAIVISVDEKLDRYKVDEVCITALSSMVLNDPGLGEFELSIHFTDGVGIAELNQQYRNKATSTDVLSFPQKEFQHKLLGGPAKVSIKPEPWDSVLGDLVISLDDAARNAASINQGLDREVCFLIVHGILHLAGHDHERRDEEAVMLAEQARIMGIFAASENLPAWARCVEAL